MPHATRTMEGPLTHLNGPDPGPGANVKHALRVGDGRKVELIIRSDLPK
jgi:hypothetical protein